MPSKAADLPAPLARLTTYLAAAITVAAMVAPPIFWAGRWAVHSGTLPLLAPFGLPTYFRRALLVLLLLGAPWVWRRAALGELAWLGRAPLAQQLRQAALGILLSLGCVGAMVAGLGCLGVMGVRPHGSRLVATFQALGTALGVGVLEELLFRGVLLQLMARRFGWQRGHVLVVLVFACVHFIAPATHGPVDEDVGWLSGVALLFTAVRPLGHGHMWLSYGSVLAVLGDTLGQAALRTGGLGLSVGLHVGLVFGARLTLLLTTLAPATAWLLTPDVRGGVAALMAMLALNVMVRLGLDDAPPVGRRGVG